MEQERIAHRKAAISEKGGHIATEREMDDHRSVCEIAASPALVNLVLDLLRMERSRNSPEDTMYSFDNDEED